MACITNEEYLYDLYVSIHTAPITAAANDERNVVVIGAHHGRVHQLFSKFVQSHSEGTMWPRQLVGRAQVVHQIPYRERVPVFFGIGVRRFLTLQFVQLVVCHLQFVGSDEFRSQLVNMRPQLCILWCSRCCHCYNEFVSHAVLSLG